MFDSFQQLSITTQANQQLRCAAEIDDSHWSYTQRLKIANA